jgi:hypothetical protein
MIEFIQIIEQKLNIIKEKLSKNETLEQIDFLDLYLASVMEEDARK